MTGGPDPKTVRRIARLLEAGPAAARAAAVQGKLLIEAPGQGVVAAAARDLQAMASMGLVARDGDRLKLTDAGRSFLRRQTVDGFQDQHRDLGQQQIEMPNGFHTATVNLAESPLGQLARRKDKAGRSFLDDREVRAGERLRSDYTHGQIMPRLSANWIASVSSGKRHGGGGMADLTDSALAARQRVELAIEAVGPELEGVLIDICCFLKGFEQVELERGWPVRSGKVVLKTALGTLARHYEPQSIRRECGARRAFRWGADDYRPRL